MSAPLYDRLGPVVAGLSPTRARLAALYDGWLSGANGRGAPDHAPRPANFIHAVISQADGRPGAAPADATCALRLALAALGDAERAQGCFSSLVAAGLFDHQAPELAQVLHDMRGRDPAGISALSDAFPDAALSRGDAVGRLGASDRQAVWRMVLSLRAHHALRPDDSGEIRSSVRLQRHVRTEAMAAPDDFWTDPGTLLPALIHGRRRLCHIECFPDDGEPRQGTGFLIGPSTVLTNFHVVDGLPDRLEAANPSAQLEIRFDFSHTTAQMEADSAFVAPHPDWCLARGELSDPGPADRDFWWDDAEARRAWLEVCKDQLDFAVIRLAEAPGLQRGWYALSTARRRRPSGAWALHHPDRREHTVTRGPIKYSAHFDHRLFHAAATAGGSSGGLILDQDGTPLGLHYGACIAGRAPQAQHERHQVLNLGIGLRQIAKRLEAEGKLEQVEMPSILRPAKALIGKDRPVFGRADLFRALTELWTSPSKRILRVDLAGEADSLRRKGKSFSGEIVRSLFTGPEHHHIIFRAGDIKVDAAQVAENALNSFAADWAGSTAPRPDTTTPAYVRRLVAEFGRAVSERLSDKAVWVVLDDLDKHDLSDGSGREFLATLYDQVGSVENLRIVLIGLPFGLAISGIAPETEIVTCLDPDDFDDLEAQFIAWMKEHGAGRQRISDDGFRLMSQLVSGMTRDQGGLEPLSDFVAEYVVPALRRFAEDDG